MAMLNGAILPRARGNWLKPVAQAIATRHNSTQQPRLVTLVMPQAQDSDKTSGSAHVARLLLSNQSGRNAFSAAMLAQLNECIEILRQDSNSKSQCVRAVIVESTVDRVFCAGADLKERIKMEPKQVADFVTALRGTLNDLSNIAVPTIAKISGAALGGGAELALVCDIRVANAGGDASTKIGFPETKLAILPGAGGTQRLARVVGLSRAKELIFTGRELSATEAFSIGLVDFIGDSIDDTERKSIELATEIANRGPVAVKWAKLAINASLSMSLQDGLQYEKHCYSKLLDTRDRIEGLNAFIEKRAPKYNGQ